MIELLSTWVLEKVAVFTQDSCPLVEETFPVTHGHCSSGHHVRAHSRAREGITMLIFYVRKANTFPEFLRKLLQKQTIFPG